MQRPENILDNGEYSQPYVFECDREKILFDSYCDHLDFIDFLQSQKPEIKFPSDEEIEKLSFARSEKIKDGGIQNTKANY